MNKPIALVIGHKPNSPGACNADGMCEFPFNEKLANAIHEKCKSYTELVYRNNYENLPYEINELNPSYIISFHCNAFDTTATGTETLYYHSSEVGRKLAEVVQGTMVDVLGLPDRGVKPKTAEDRGGYLLANTYAPCVIAESFFIDNTNDLTVGLTKFDNLVNAFVELIDLKQN